MKITPQNRTAGLLHAALGLLAAIAMTAGPLSADSRTAAREVLKAGAVRGGLVVHIGGGDGKLTAALGAEGPYVVRGLDRDPANVAKAREHIRSKGLYGRVSAAHWSGGRLPYADNLVSLLIAEDASAATKEEILRVLAPGGASCVKGPDGTWRRTVKPRPADIDEWTHDLHDAGGNPVARDRVVGPPRHLQWTAGPLWARSHGYTPSVSAMVSAGGRLFYICDETLTGLDDSVPSKWYLVARNAFSGVLLWKVPVPQWGPRQFSGTRDVGGSSIAPKANRPGPPIVNATVARFTMPPQVGKRLVAVGEDVFVTLGAGAPVTAIDAATGKVRRVYAETARADEVLCTGGRLIVTINPPDEARPPVAEKGEIPVDPPGKDVCAVDVETGRVLWKRGPFVGVRSSQGQDPFGRLELAAGDGKVFALTTEAVECLDAATGKRLWRTDRPALPAEAVRKLGYARMFEYLLTVLVYRDGVVLLAQPEPNTHHTYHTMPGSLYAFDAGSGKQMWKHAYGAWGHCTQPDVFVIGDVVWTHVNAETEFGSVWGSGFRAKDSSTVDYRIQALDLRTGRPRKELGTRMVFNVGHHHRCYRNRTTERFLMASRRGVEFVNLATGENQQHHWVRSGCLLGNLPANGLLTVAPHPCGCYIEAKLTGFNALAPAAKAPQAEPTAEADRLVKGPAYAAIRPSTSSGPGGNPQSDDWPTYRGNARRTGASGTTIGAGLKVAWRTAVGGRPSGLTVAGGKVFVADVDAHTVHALSAADGADVWTHAADARVDSPPTIDGGRAIFGSADGRVYCLRADDGALAWRFDAAPTARRVISHDQLESPWPVSGGVLMHEGKCWFSGGRSSYLDGGIRLYALDPATGKVAHRRTIESGDPKTGAMAAEPSPNKVAGVLNDILGTDGQDVFLRQMNVTSPDGGGRLHLYTSGGFLDSSLFNRTFWKAGRAQSAGLMVLGENAAYGVELYSSRSRETVFTPGAGGFRLRCVSMTAAPTAPAAKPPKGKKKPGISKAVWEQKMAIRITAMVLAGETLFVAGSPDIVDPKDPHAAWEGRKGGLLVAYAAADGKKLAEYKLPAPPVWDGLAAAGGRLYLSTTDGNVTCFAGK